jgi:hypothetical protein
LPPTLRTAAFRTLDRSDNLKAATLLVAAHRDATAPERWQRMADAELPIPMFH